MELDNRRPLVLVVLDGWGVNSRKEGNAILQAATPRMDELAEHYPSTTLSISGSAVGLPEGQMGNSEVGHMHLGSGRVVYQDLTLINRAIEDGSFFTNSVFLDAIQQMRRSKGRLHLMGLLGDGGVHSHQRHLEALIDLALKEKVEQVFLHLFTDGRDTSPTSGEGFIISLEEKLNQTPNVRIATLCGRYYAMDRDKRWDRTRKAYRALTEGKGGTAESALEGIRKSYKDNKTDEFVLPTVIRGVMPQGRIQDGDAVIFFNFRADRARQMTLAFTRKKFKEFARQRQIQLASFVTMTEYDQTFKLPAGFRRGELKGILGEIVSREGMRQLRIAETEKYAHVTYFFNGGEEKKFPLEDRLLIPSTKEVSTYDQKPEMSANEITDALLKRMSKVPYGLVVLNYANADMVGHTGKYEATVKACEVVDACVGRVMDYVLKQKGRALITGDHGNAEQMIDYDTGKVHTAHTSNPVPLILVDEDYKSSRMHTGSAADVAPTIVKLLEIPLPGEMTGRPLLE